LAAKQCSKVDFRSYDIWTDTIVPDQVEDLKDNGQPVKAACRVVTEYPYSTAVAIMLSAEADRVNRLRDALMNIDRLGVSARQANANRSILR
jgi:hypothetical protein